MKIHYKFIFLILLGLFNNIYYIHAQNKLKANSIYTELAGNAVVYSINYDRLIPVSKQLKLAPRFGIEFLPNTRNADYGNVSIPLEVNALWAKRPESKNYIEAGLGLSLIALKEYYLTDNGTVDYKNKFARVTIGRLGFRHQKPSGGFMYRIGLLIPIVQDQYSLNRVGDDIFLRLYAGFSLGYTF